jgi:hypothetical protein
MMSITRDPAPFSPPPQGEPPINDPVYLHARREALTILGLWLAALLYTLTVCYIWGYDRDPATLTYVWGIPDWVFYGVMLPWAFCNLFTIWFCFFFAVEDDLAAEGEEASADMTSERRPTSPTFFRRSSDVQ